MNHPGSAVQANVSDVGRQSRDDRVINHAITVADFAMDRSANSDFTSEIAIEKFA